MSGPPEGAFAVRLDATDADLESAAEVAAQVPRADERPPGSIVAIAPVATRKRGALGRLFGDGHVKVSRVARCTALLARGYVDLRAEGDAVWGSVPVSPASAS
jgi:hypothetical protein